MAEAFDDGPSVLYQLHRASPDLEESGPYTHRGVFPAIQTANAKPRFPIGHGPVQLFHHEADVVDGSEDLQREVRAAHDHIERAFEGSITDRLRDVFGRKEAS
jgi:hypothetical protein